MTPGLSADDAFAERPFLVRDALRLGYGADVFDHPRWHRPFRGVRSKLPLPGHLSGRALQYLPRLRPHDRFSHATALAILGCPIRVPKNAPVDVSSPERPGPVACRGTRGHRHRSPSEEYLAAHPDHDHWIPTTPPLEAVLQSAIGLPFPELVVALDFLLLPDPKRYDQHLHISPEELRRFAVTARGRGAARFREAAALARVGAESRMETLMRLANARVGGPELRLQAELRSAAGEWIGRFDGVDDGTRSIFEYDGEQHVLSRRQRRRDPRKHQAARDAGWRLMVLYSEDVLVPGAEAGRRMLAFSGREQRPIRAALARLLDERSGDDTESAVPLPRREWEP